MIPVAIVHDYLTQRRGAERVVAAMARAFPDAPIHTSLHLPEATWENFSEREVRTSPLDRVKAFRRHHRVALPLYPVVFSRMEVDAEVAICSSSGWAHGARVTGRKVVYCYTPARWLYQTDRYLGERDPVGRTAIGLLGPWLRRWDGRAARTAHRYLAISTAVRDRIRDLYGIEAEVLHPPHTARLEEPREPVPDLDPGFLLCVARRRPYKNLEAVVQAFGWLPDTRLVVVGSAPDRSRVEPGNVRYLESPADPILRWLYAHCAGVVSASYEDFGLVPVEAAAFGKPTAALRFGGHLDTVTEGETGVFFDEPVPLRIASAVTRLRGRNWDASLLHRHAARFSEERFVRRLREIVVEERTRLREDVEGSRAATGSG